MYLTQGSAPRLQQHPDRIAVRFGSVAAHASANSATASRVSPAPCRRSAWRAGDRVAMLALNSDRYLEYQLAVPWGGGVLNPCNIRWSAAEIVYSLDDSGSSILLVDETFQPMVEAIRRDAHDAARGDLSPATATAPARHARLRGAARRGRAGRRRLPRRRRPRRHLLHRRHHRLPEGRDAQPREPVRLGHGAARPRACSPRGTSTCTPRRCSTSPTSASRSAQHLAGNTHVDRSGLQPRGGARVDRSATASPTCCWCRR